MARFVALIVAVCLFSELSADTFHLRSGGRLQGDFLNRDESPRQTYRIRLDTGGEVTLALSEVTRVVSLSAKEQRYHEILEKMPDTAEAHWKMAELCKQWSLLRERKIHLENTIRLDPDHEDARRILKFKRQSDGTWARTEDLNRAAGLVRHDGRWMTKEQAELEALAEQRRKQAIEWKKNLKLWRGWLGDRRRRNKAIQLIEAIDDPLASGPLIELFWSEKNVAVRELLAEVLGRLGTGSCARALAQAAMQGDTEVENDLRLYAIRQLEKNNLTGVVPNFVAELRSANNVAVRRAGYALGELGDEAVVLPLIKALRTKHTRLVGGAGNGNINLTRGGLSVGRSKPKKVDEMRNNKEVRNALVKLTKKDFEYNTQAWLNWYLANNTPPSYDLRRDL